MDALIAHRLQFAFTVSADRQNKAWVRAVPDAT